MANNKMITTTAKIFLLSVYDFFLFLFHKLKKKSNFKFPMKYKPNQIEKKNNNKQFTKSLLESEIEREKCKHLIN